MRSELRSTSTMAPRSEDATPEYRHSLEVTLEITASEVTPSKISSAEVPLETLFEALLIALSEAVAAEHGASAEEASHDRGPKEATGVEMGTGKHAHQARRRDATQDALRHRAAQHAARTYLRRTYLRGGGWRTRCGCFLSGRAPGGSPSEYPVE